MSKFQRPAFYPCIQFFTGSKIFIYSSPLLLIWFFLESCSWLLLQPTEHPELYCTVICQWISNGRNPMWLPGEDMHSWWGCAFLVRMCFPGEDVLSWWRCAFQVRHIPIPGEDTHSIVIYPHWEWGYASSGMHILTRNGDVPHREWRCTSLGMHILNGNGDVPHRECT